MQRRETTPPMSSRGTCVRFLPRVEGGIPRGLADQLGELAESRSLVWQLYRYRLKERYHGSGLGLLWTLVNPLLMMAGLALIFPLLIRVNMADYILYLFAGITTWGLISGAVAGGGESILSNVGLIRRVYVPRQVFPLVTVLIEITNLVVALIALHLIGILFGLHIATDLPYLLAAIVVTGVFAIGVAYVFSILVVYFRDLKHIMGVGLQAVFYITPIIYPVAMLPENARAIMEWNPLFQFVRLFQLAIHSPAAADWSYFPIPLLIAAAVLLLGMVMQWRFGRVLIYRL